MITTESGLYRLIDSSALTQDEKAEYAGTVKSLLKSLPTDGSQQKGSILSSIPLTTSPTCIPIACLSTLLASRPGQWDMLDIIRAYNKVWKAAPESVKAKSPSEDQDLVDSTLVQVKASYQGLQSFIQKRSNTPALIDPVSGVFLTHSALTTFVSEFRLPSSRQHMIKPVVGIAIPNSAQLGLACLAVATYYTALPINATGGSEQFRIDVQQAHAKVLLVARTYLDTLELQNSWVSESDIEILVVDFRADLTFDITPLYPKEQELPISPSVNGPDDIAFILFTSGTSGTKKLVPLTIHSIVCGVTFVIDSWGLSEADCCLNMMPLNHVGGLVRNLFAPIISGGSTICCSAFDPNLFWDVVEEHTPTWYYASPSMHSTILAEVQFRQDALLKSQIRLICNAAGGLLPTLAIQLRETFRCTVLPSYGMTECMPISTPPLNYELDRPGTSGISVGPEIAILDSDQRLVEPYTVGHLCVRGSPIFPGYITNSGYLDISAFNESGWFDTGDMGYLDNDEYLYVTGRSKEVINRGGELISPLEVEEAVIKAANDIKSPVYGKIAEALAFSVPHDVLQEVVGIIIVTRPDRPRPDLRQLQEALKSSLHSVKWPVLMVYMDDLPKNNNKILRVRMAERLKLETITDSTTLGQRHLQAICPPPGTPLGQSIENHQCSISPDMIESVIEEETGYLLDSHISINPHDNLLTVVLAPESPESSPETSELLIEDLKIALLSQVDGYLVPSSITSIPSPFPLCENGEIDYKQVELLLEEQNPVMSTEGLLYHEVKIRNIFAEILSCSPADITSDSDFFELGGDSLKGGKLLSIIRRELNVRVPVERLFTHSSVQSLCDFVADQLAAKGNQEFEKTLEIPLPKCEVTHSSTNPFLMTLQLIPMLLMYPMKRALEWTILLYGLSTAIWFWPKTTTLFTRLVILLIYVVIAKTATHIIAPLFAIVCKWIIIGRYKEGLYPMWGVYHTRWWLTQKILAVGGKGVFNRFNFTRILFYRLLGAKIGSGVNIDVAAKLGEYDLLEIGNGVELDNCTCRPFAAEGNTAMYLGRIKLGDNSSVGLKSMVAAGTILPPGTCIGPNSSSWEMSDATESNRDLSRNRIPQPMPITQALIGWPIYIIIQLIALGPRAAALVGLVQDQPDVIPDMQLSVIVWFSSPFRVGYHFLALILGGTMGRFVYFLVVVALKRGMDWKFGKVPAGSAANRSELTKFRMWLMSILLPGGDLTMVTGFFGTHYNFTTWAVRALGGKVGERVYWPGHGPAIQDFDLIDIGDDVVFGSRSHIVTSDGSGSQHVRIGNGSMIADRVVLLPGSILEENVVMGSGALSRRNTIYSRDTVWVGSKNGSAVCLTATDRKASYTSSITLVEPGDPSFVGSPTFTRPGSIRQIPVDVEKADIPANMGVEHLPIKVHELHEKLGRHTTVGSIGAHKSTAQSPPHESPFGRAFYEGKANYHVLGQFSIFLISIFMNIFTTIYWNITAVATVQVLAQLEDHFPDMFNKGMAKPILIWACTCGLFSIFLIFQTIFAVSIILTSKWLLMRRRQPGSYDWDQSSYCQRWQILLIIEQLRRTCFGGNGIVGMLTGTHYVVLYFRALGATIGRDCALFAGGKPSLTFTEPDLLTLGDRVSVDDASLVSHINSRGSFSLNRLYVGDRSVLRSGSRLLSGGQMEADTCLLEHTLVMGGDLVDQGSTCQGWPADVFTRQRVTLPEEERKKEDGGS